MPDFDFLGKSLKGRASEATTYNTDGLRTEMTAQFGTGGTPRFQDLRKQVGATLVAATTAPDSSATIAYVASPAVPDRQAATVLNTKFTP